jgi:seryl-tRNA synthetase
MSIRKKKMSASDVLRQEMQQPQQPSVSVASQSAPEPESNSQPNLIPNTMTEPKTDNADQAKLEAQVAELQSKLTKQTKELSEASATIVKLANQGKAAPASNAPRRGGADSNRPVQTSEETALRRANTDIGWLD